MADERPVRVVGRAWAVMSWIVVIVLSALAAFIHFVLYDSAATRIFGSVYRDVAAVARFLAPAAFATLGSAIVLRHAFNRVAALFSLAAVAWAGANFAKAYSSVALYQDGYVAIGGRVFSPIGAETALWFAGWASWAAAGALTTGLFLVFPNGRLPSRRWLPVATLSALTIGALTLRAAFGPANDVRLREFEIPAFEVLGYQLSVLGRAIEILALLFLLSVAASAASLVPRYLRADQDVRQQLKWFLFAALIAAIPHVLLPLLGFAGQLTHHWGLVLLVGVAWSSMFVAAGAAVAVFKYRLYDIDFVINKTLVFGALSLFITSAYVAVTVGVGRMIADEGTATLLSVLAMSPVAVGFAPMRTRTQRLADRLVYGERAEPYEILAAFARELPATVRVEEVMPRVAASVGEGLRAASVRLHLYLTDAGERVVTWPTETGGADEQPDLVVPIDFRGAVIGRLEVAKRRGESVTREDRRLARVLVRHGAIALQNVRLTLELEERGVRLRDTATELRASRRRLVEAQLEVRRAVEAELQARVRPHLASVPPALDRFAAIAARDMTSALAMLDDAEKHAGDALSELRDIAHGVFSPMVAEVGIVVALESHVRRLRRPISVRPTGDIRGRRFEPRIELAVYACCAEVIRLTSVELDVQLEASTDALELRLAGPTFDPLVELGPRSMQNLADRLDTIGGSLDVVYSAGSTGAIVGRVPTDQLAVVA